MTATPIDALVQAAGAAARAGRWDDAEALWKQVSQLDPRHPGALFSLGVHAMRRGDFAQAVSQLEEAQRANPKDLFTLLSLAKAKRGAGDDKGEGEAIDTALAIDPYYLPALLAKAQRMERNGAANLAGFYYRTAVKLAPPEQQWPDMLRGQLAHAREFATKQSGVQAGRLTEALGPLLAGMTDHEAERWREAASIMAGASQPYRQEANQLYVPRLPARPFHDLSAFPWASALEARTGAIRDELKAALASEGKSFTPYISLQPGQPVDQWAGLNSSARWSHYSLWRGGRPDQAHLAACPKTREALSTVEMAEIGGLCPNAMFSMLAPHTEIPPHTGETNARLVAHLPLVVPDNCTYRVGFEHRQWREGELLIFDDTIEHTARNDSDEPRIVLIFDVWNPLLSTLEREAAKTLAAAMRAEA